MSRFFAQKSTALVADDSQVNTPIRQMFQEFLGTRQRRQMAEMNGTEKVIEQLFRFRPIGAEQHRKTITKRRPDPALYIGPAPDRMAHFTQRMIERRMDHRPAVDQGIIPIEQDRPG